MPTAFSVANMTYPFTKRSMISTMKKDENIPEHLSTIPLEFQFYSSKMELLSRDRFLQQVYKLFDYPLIVESSRENRCVPPHEIRYCFSV